MTASLIILWDVITGAILWNNLPKEITNIEELGDFKIELLAYYQNSYTDDRNA